MVFKIAIIADEFTELSLAPDCLLHNLTLEKCSEEIISFKPDLLLVESAWHGFKNQWHGKISSCSVELQALLKTCNSEFIPTVFWSKEDPFHFNLFLLTASLFDFVFTTDLNCVPHYKALLKHTNVFVLPFGVQPKIYNPIGVKNKIRKACFVGSYYKKYHERSKDFDSIANALDGIIDFDIYDRYHNVIDNNYLFPERFKSKIIGRIPYLEINAIYQKYQYSINLNTVKTSDSMFSRRVFELLASGSILISNYSSALPFLFGDLVIASDNEIEIRDRVNKISENETLAVKLLTAGIRKVMLEHTYAHRLSRIANKVLANHDDLILPSILVIFVIDNIGEVHRVFRLLSVQLHSNWSCICIAKSKSVFLEISSLKLDWIKQYFYISDLKNISFNELVGEALWIAFFDPCDYYGPNYLLDLVLGSRYSTATAFCKQQFYEVMDKEIVLKEDKVGFQPKRDILLRSSLIARINFVELSAYKAVLNSSISIFSVDDSISLDYLSYCRNAFNQNEVSIQDISNIVDDSEFNMGSSINELYIKADALRIPIPFWVDKPGWRPKKLANIFGDRFTRDITGSTDRFGWHIISKLPDGDTCNLFSEFAIPIEDLGGQSGTLFYMEAGVGLQMQLLVRFEGVSGALMDEAIYEINMQNQLMPPDSCSHIRLGYRITSSGSTRITRLVLS